MTSARRGGNPARPGLAGLAGLLLIVELLPRLRLVNDRFLPPTSRIAAALADEVSTSTFWHSLGETLYAWAIGLVVAVVAGVLAGLVIGSVPLLRALTASTVEFLRPIPSVALIPLAVLLYGTQLGSTLLLVCYAAFWQVLVQVLYGVADVDPVAEETARSFRFSAWGRVRHVLWPTALPYVFTGFRLAASVALVLTVTAELVIGAPGLGKEIATAQNSDAVATMYALIVVTGALGVVINLLTRTGERRLLAWHQSVRGEVTV
ncbi:ABC transporter permease [Actinoplanes siamensis]|uniref:Nitrate ABC transporter permease n=1 Tax=Actinoplanes siamensis TaxID=1223317 RepID=A0A919NAU8_9ACTN|nr:ABC transporter permease subunit [Actinoplanes siamensis]GIF07415.1 nitrate ABC transporter permease [Actinoplanes siamensis]